MILSKETTDAILDLDSTDAPIRPEDMAKTIILTFFPFDESKVSKNVLDFSVKLKESLVRQGVRFISYDDALVKLSTFRRPKVYIGAIINTVSLGIARLLGVEPPAKKQFTVKELRHVSFGRKVRKGVSVIALGDHETGNLAMDNTMSFRKTSVISIVDKPSHIDADTDFLGHFETAMDLFTYHMANIVIAVTDKDWILYNMNASHPTFPIESDHFDSNVLYGLVPKIASPIVPPKISDFDLLSNQFDPNDKEHKSYIEDFIASGALLEQTKLYPPGRSLDSMKFRNNFYRWIGALHLDHRNGMSYGYLARQLPFELSRLIPIKEAEIEFGMKINTELFSRAGNLYMKVPLYNEFFILKVPEVWVLSSRSGAKKTELNASKDILKMGLVNGKMMLQLPKGMNKIDPACKPSFDTRVILAHALGNALVASILNKINSDSLFADKISKNGSAIAHWHGYINSNHIPHGWYVHGNNNPHVSCSSPQSAYYSLWGKLTAFYEAISNNELWYGDIHTEPHHGINITYWSLSELGSFLSSEPEISELGNKYLDNNL